MNYRRCGQSSHNVKTYRGVVRSKNTKNIGTLRATGKQSKGSGNTRTSSTMGT